MCGYVGYEQSKVHEQPQWYDNMSCPLILKSMLDCWPEYTAYPAFGGDTTRRIPLLINENGSLKQVQAVWWFDTFLRDSETFIGGRTSFNARNLSSPFWNSALNNNRAIVLATELGESKLVGKTKHQYLMQSSQSFMLGALYQKLENGDYSCAIITRDTHPKMEPYHDKAFPFFLPMAPNFMDLWLSDVPADNPQIITLLEKPKLYPTLNVTRVKTYKNKQKVGSTDITLMSDVT